MPFQVQCLSIDSRGTLLLTGDESGVICVRRLYGRHSSISSQGDQGVQDTADRSKNLGAEGGLDSGGEGGVAKVIKGAHDGGVLAITHVDGSLRATEDGKEFGSSSALFVSGGKGEGQGKASFVAGTGQDRTRGHTGGVQGDPPFWDTVWHTAMNQYLAHEGNTFLWSPPCAKACDHVLTAPSFVRRRRHSDACAADTLLGFR